MNSDFKPGPVSPNPPENTGDRLAGALEQLILGRSSRGDAPLPNPIDHDKSAPPDAGAGPCPEPGEWAFLLGGEVRPADIERVDALLTHMAGCNLCAGRLRILQADISPEESAMLAGLRTASVEGQRPLAAELARTARAGARNKTSQFYLWMGAGLAASLLIVFGLTTWWRQSNDPERLLAEAYTHSRIFDLRMPGSGFAEITPGTHLRGGSTGRESSKLLEARAAIEHRLEAAPEDAHWLQLEARSDIIEEKFDPAVDILDRLVAAGSVTASLLLDDASAYFQRGEATGSENDRATALDLLRRADELAPGDTVVLFNEAVVMEDRGQIMNAVETWNRYLRFERDPRWLTEGRRRLQALEQKLNELKSHSSRMQQHLATPQAMRSLAADPATLASIDEELSTTLLPRILDAAFPQIPAQPTAAQSRGSPCSENCQSARTLLYSLSASLERNHQDPWLTQLLAPKSPQPDSSSTDPHFLQAAHTLAQSIDAEVHGDYLSAAENAQKASQLFQPVSNGPKSSAPMPFRPQRIMPAATRQLTPCWPAMLNLPGFSPRLRHSMPIATQRPDRMRKTIRRSCARRIWRTIDTTRWLSFGSETCAAARPWTPATQRPRGETTLPPSGSFTRGTIRRCGSPARSAGWSRWSNPRPARASRFSSNASTLEPWS